MSPNNAPLPLEPEELDELLSAALDGDLESAAHDLGMSVDEADARVRATPGADERRTALAAARDLLGVTPPLDDLLAARLRAKAVRAAQAAHTAHADDRRRRRNRILLSAGGIAAGVAAIVAVATGVQPDGTGSQSASSPAPTAERSLTSPTSAGAKPSALGSFTDTRALALAAVQSDTVTHADGRLKSELGPGYGTDTQTSTVTGRSAAATPSAAATATQNAVGNASDKTDAPTQNRTQYDAVAGSAATCTAPPEVPNVATPVLRASATLAGKPVVVLVYANATEHVVVIEDTACKLVNLQMLP